MKFKTLSFAIFSAFMLSACGGGASSGTDNGTGTGTGTGTGNTTINDSEWSAYELSYADDSENLFNKITFTAKGNTQYLRVDYLSDSNNTENFDPNESYLLNDYLTDEGFYELELNKDPQLGYKIGSRSEEHTSELQSRENLVCRLLLEK